MAVLLSGGVLVLIQKVEEFIAVVLLSVWLCVDLKGCVRCCDCFTFCGGVLI